MLNITATHGPFASSWQGIGVLWLVLLISACAPIRDVPKPLVVAPSPTLDRLWGAVLDKTPNDDDWIASFNDPHLSSLVVAAGTYNRDITGLMNRMHDAEMLIQRAGDHLLPTLAAGDTAADDTMAEELGDSYGDTLLAIETPWLTDLLMRLRQEAKARQKKTPDPEVLLNDTVLRDVLLQYRHYLASLIARSWFIAVGNKLQIRLKRDFLKTQRDTRHWVLSQAPASSSSGDIERLRREVVQTQGVVMRHQDHLDDAMRALEILLGQRPLVELDAVQALPVAIVQVPDGLSATLLERRSDIRFADHRVTDSLQRAPGARSTQIPPLSLTAVDGSPSKVLVDTLQENNPEWSTVTIFLRPRRGGEGRYLNTKRQSRALDRYSDSVKQALQGVMAVLQNEHHLRVYRAVLDKPLVALAGVAHIKEKQYKAGEIALSAFDEAQVMYFALRSNLLNFHVERLKQRVNLHLAVAGSFD